MYEYIIVPCMYVSALAGLRVFNVCLSFDYILTASEMNKVC